MSRKQKIPINTATSGLNAPFAGLSAAGLPAGEAATPGPAATEPPAKPVRRGRVVLRRETAQRGGKTVTVVDDFELPLGGAALEDLARRLRKVCGCGGTVKGRAIELQGDQAAKVRALLEAEGFRVAGVR